MRPFTKFSLLAWLGCLFAASAPAHAKDALAASSQAAVKICTQSWNGTTNTDMTGLYWDTFYALFEPLGIKINGAFMPYKLSILRVQNGDCDIAFSAYMNEFDLVLFPKWPHEIQRVIAVHDADTIFTSQRSFIGKKSAWLTDYGFEKFLPAMIDFEEVRSEALGLRKLERGRIDFFVDYETNVKKAAAATGVDLSQYTLSRVNVLSQKVYPMFRLDDRGHGLVNLYDSRMAELYEDGTLDRIYAKYRVDRGDYPAPSME